MGTRNPIGGPFKRRVRRPFGTRGAKRPVRWIEGNSSHGAEPLPVVTAFPYSPSIDTSGWPVLGGTELIFGDDDLDWMDKNEATIERVVGDVTTLAFFQITEADNLITQIPFRLGLLVVEEVEDISTWVPPSLWDRESIEEYEWMWLYQSCVTLTFPRPASGTGNTAFGNETVHVDSKIHRKIGKKDHLVLLGQYGLSAATPGIFAIEGLHLIRVLFKV